MSIAGNMKKILIIIGMLILCICICVFSIPFMFVVNNLLSALTSPPDLRRYVTRDELIGVWVPSAETERIIAREKPTGERPSKCHITLRRDGACEFDSVYEVHYRLTYLRSLGSWILEHDTEGSSNRRRKNAVAFDMDESGFAGNMHLYLKEKDGRLMLWEWCGDPDAWSFIEYVKEEEHR